MKETEIYRNVLFLGEINVNNQYNFPTTAGATGQVLTYDGLGNVVWTSISALTLTTTDVAEGTNLYFTQDRAEDVVGNLIQNGTGLNWTYNDGANTMIGNINLSPFTTNNLAEGASALYFTNERVDDRVNNLMIGSTGINFVYGDISNTLTVSIDFGDFTTDDVIEGVNNRYFTNERVDDRVAVLIKNGTGISWFYNDGAGLLTPTVTLDPFTTNDLAEGASALYFTNERVDDRVANLMINSPTVVWTYDDFSNTLSAESTSIINVQEAGATQSSRPTLNFIEGPGTSISVTDDGVNNRANITVSVNNTGSIFEESVGSLSTVRKSVGATASGPYNMVLGGKNNTSSGAYHSIIIGGTGNSTSNTPHNTIVNGIRNTTSGYSSTIINGRDNEIINSSFSNILNGYNNTIGIGGAFTTIFGHGNNSSGGATFRLIIGDQNEVVDGSHAYVNGISNVIRQSLSSHVSGSYNIVDLNASYSTITTSSGCTSDASYTFIASALNSDTAGLSGVKILGSNIVATAANTTYVENFNIATLPTTSTEDALLVRNASTGQIEIRSAGGLAGVYSYISVGATASTSTQLIDTNTRVFVNHSVPFTVVGATAPSINTVYEIIDALAIASSQNITFDGNGKLIYGPGVYGASTWTINVDAHVLKVVYNGTSYNVI